MQLNLAKINTYGAKFIQEINEISMGLELQLFAMERYNASHKKQITEIQDEAAREMLIDAVQLYIKIRTKHESDKIDDNAYKVLLKSQGVASIEYILNRFRQGKYSKKVSENLPEKPLLGHRNKI